MRQCLHYCLEHFLEGGATYIYIYIIVIYVVPPKNTQSHISLVFTVNNCIFWAPFFLVKINGREYTLNKGDNSELVSSLNSELKSE